MKRKLEQPCEPETKRQQVAIIPSIAETIASILGPEALQIWNRSEEPLAPQEHSRAASPGAIIEIVLESTQWYMYGKSLTGRDQIYCLTTPALLPNRCYGSSQINKKHCKDPATPYTWNVVRNLKTRTRGFEHLIDRYPFVIMPNWATIKLFVVPAGAAFSLDSANEILWVGTHEERRLKVQLYHRLASRTSATAAAQILHWTCLVQISSSTPDFVHCVFHQYTNGTWPADLHVELSLQTYANAIQPQ